MTTIADLYNHYDAGCGTETPMRTVDELRDLLHEFNIRYDDPRAIDAFWILVFGREDAGSDCWAWDLEGDYPHDAEIVAFHAAREATS
jgi:hypothetical protein